jgi:hypothetical protein
MCVLESQQTVSVPTISRAPAQPKSVQRRMR